MLTLEIIFAALFGLAFGSFLNVCISRLPRHESIVRPPSRCPNCRAPIGPRDNIPVVSYLLLRGRCRHCGWRILRRYPVVEVSTAILAVASLLTTATIADATTRTVFCSLLLSLAVCDAETLLLPDTLTLTLLALGLLVRIGHGYLAGRGDGVFEAWRHGGLFMLRGAIAAVAAAFLLWMVGWIYTRLRHRQGIGFGDVKLVAAIAAWVGARQTLLVLFLAVVGGALAGLAFLALRPRKIAGKGPLAIPFGMFLAFAGIYCAFAGAATVDWYLSLFPS